MLWKASGCWICIRVLQHLGAQAQALKPVFLSLMLRTKIHVIALRCQKHVGELPYSEALFLEGGIGRSSGYD
jgi:hypothetical protein